MASYSKGERERTMATHHIAAQPGARHRREVRRSGVVLAAADDGHAAQLT